jgi:hypothetical protein
MRVRHGAVGIGTLAGPGVREVEGSTQPYRAAKHEELQRNTRSHRLECRRRRRQLLHPAEAIVIAIAFDCSGEEANRCPIFLASRTGPGLASSQSRLSR